jgi:hypothetical protein
MKNAPSRAEWRAPEQGLHSVKFVVFQKDRSRATLNYVLVCCLVLFYLVARWRFCPVITMLCQTRPRRKKNCLAVGSWKLGDGAACSATIGGTIKIASCVRQGMTKLHCGAKVFFRRIQP